MSIVGQFVMFSHRSDDTFDSTFAAKKYYLCRNLSIYNKFHYPKNQNLYEKVSDRYSADSIFRAIYLTDIRLGAAGTPHSRRVGKRYAVLLCQ